MPGREHVEVAGREGTLVNCLEW